jgi:uncharacterized protein YndB with AHSA1/START domain
VTALALAHSLERTVAIRATPQTVFRFFTDSARWASWWGAGSEIDPHVGGAVLIRHPNGVAVTGEVLEIVAPERIVFTYGDASGTPIPAGGSRVTVQLEARDGGTVLTLTHEFADVAPRDEHVQGWRYQLSVFSNLVSNEVNARAAQAVDGWFHVWSLGNVDERTEALHALATPGVQFRDRFSAVAGIEELVPHLGAFQRFMAGLRLARTGDIRHCQGTVLADWTATTDDGTPRGSGTNVFVFDAAGKVESVTGFWN